MRWIKSFIKDGIKDQFTFFPVTLIPVEIGLTAMVLADSAYRGFCNGMDIPAFGDNRLYQALGAYGPFIAEPAAGSFYARGLAKNGWDKLKLVGKSIRYGKKAHEYLSSTANNNLETTLEKPENEASKSSENSVMTAVNQVEKFANNEKHEEYVKGKATMVGGGLGLAKAGVEVTVGYIPGYLVGLVAKLIF